MKEKIQHLTELQDIDLEIASLDEQIHAKQSAIAGRKKALEECRVSITELEQRIKDMETQRREKEAMVTDETSRIKERQSKMMQVQTNREYQSLLKEIEEGKRANKDREEDVVQLMEKVEAMGKILEEQASMCKNEEKALSSEAGETEKEISSLENQKKKIIKKRETKAKDCDPMLLRKHDTLRKRRTGKAVVNVDGSICQGCFMSIPPQQYNEIIRGEQLLNCPTCQRILFYQESAQS